MINIKDKKDCCGCGACAIVCPTNAIQIKKDKYGFTFPEITEDKCIDCGACEAGCPILNYTRSEIGEQKAFAAYANDSNTRFKGSSGGMFGLLAKHIISKGGIVYGAAFDKDLKLKCASADSVDELEPLYKSKYLQSDLNTVFPKIKELLIKGKPVLFVSAPCQVYALKLFLKKDYSNLLTVDFVCHGVPSQDLFDRCKKYLENKKKIKIISYQFRAKQKDGSTPHYYKMRYIKNGKTKEKTEIYINSPFYYGYQKYITLRDSCYACPFSYRDRVSDITISDFHNIDKYISGINRFDGVSTVVTNTDKGLKTWKVIKDQCTLYEIDFKMLLKNGELMCGSTKKPKERDSFIKDLVNQPFEKVVKAHLNGSKEIFKKAYYKLPNSVRKNIKKMLGK